MEKGRKGRGGGGAEQVFCSGSDVFLFFCMPCLALTACLSSKFRICCRGLQLGVYIVLYTCMSMMVCT